MDQAPRLFRTNNDWRAWLARNHDRSKGIWLAYYKKSSGKRSVTYEEALEEALCFGWIDSTVGRIDDERYKQRFTPRNDKSSWSPSNKARVEKLISEGRLAPPGLAKVEAAKRNGTWDSPRDMERVGPDPGTPSDLLQALAGNQRARNVFDSLPPSHKKQYALWILSAKKPETRARRVAETVKRALAGCRPGM